MIIFINECLVHSPLPLLQHDHEVDVVGVSITLNSGDTLRIKSMYNPKGDVDVFNILSTEAEGQNLFIFGDLNAHSPHWEDVEQSNRAGKNVERLLLENNHIVVLTPYNLPTYYNSKNNKHSTIDIQLGPASAIDQVSISRVPDLHSDHCAIKTIISHMSCETKPRKRKFINKKGKWPVFKQMLQEADYTLLENSFLIDDKVNTLTKIIMDAAQKTIPKTNNNDWTSRGNKRTKDWWNDLCTAAVEAKHIARKAFQRHPSMITVIEYKRSSAIVKKTCLQAKKEAWDKFMTRVDHCTAVSKIHQYVSKMNGNKMALDDRKYEIKHQGQLITSDNLKAEIFAKTYMKNDVEAFLPNPPVCVLSSVAQHKKSLILPFELSELDTAIEECNQNSAPGYDEVHIKWLIESPHTFRKKLLEVCNISWREGNFPNPWKIALIHPCLLYTSTLPTICSV